MVNVILYDPELSEAVTKTATQLMHSLRNLRINWKQLPTVEVGYSVKEFFIFEKDSRVWSKKKYNFSRAKWYVAGFSIKDYVEVDKWCEQQFGPHPTTTDAWSRWCWKFDQKIQFRDEKDYVLFLLRWGSQ